jgi:hypothetical protein
MLNGMIPGGVTFGRELCICEVMRLRSHDAMRAHIRRERLESLIVAM